MKNLPTTLIALALTVVSAVPAFAHTSNDGAESMHDTAHEPLLKAPFDSHIDEGVSCDQLEKESVCGTDGVTYANECYLETVDGTVAHDGICEPAKWTWSSESKDSEQLDSGTLNFQIFKGDNTVISGSKDDFVVATYIMRERLMVLEEVIERALENERFTELEEQGLMDILDSLAALVDIRGDLAETASLIANMESLDVTVGFCSIYGTLVNEALNLHANDPMVRFLNWLSSAETDQDALYAQERRTNTDWNNDGVIGDPNSRRNRRRRGNGVIIVLDWLNGQSVVDAMTDVGGLEQVNAMLQRLSDELNAMIIQPDAEIHDPVRSYK
ncbi:MAG: Kazal-type serine protease inhibitor family protein [Bradymonadia bacterium]